MEPSRVAQWVVMTVVLMAERMVESTVDLRDAKMVEMKVV